MRKSTIILFVIAIIVLGALFRLWNIHDTPPGLYPDEAMNANDAIESIETGTYRVFYDDNNGREGLFVWLIALSFSLFGVSVSSLRIVSVIGGLLAIPGVYFLTRSLLRDHWVALLATFFTAVSFWHVLFSRIGFRAIWMVALLIWGMWFLWEGMQKKSYWRMALSGAIIALSFYTYVGVRVFPLAIGLIAILFIYQNGWNNKHTWLLLGVATLAGLIVIAPLGLFFIQNLDQISARSGDVSIFGAEEPLQELITSTIKTAGMFNVFGDCNWRHNYASPVPFSGTPCAPMLFWVVGLFAIVGFLLSLITILRGSNNRSSHIVILIWFAVMLLPAILTREGMPHALRSIGVIPIPYIYASIGAIWLTKKLGKPRPWWIAVLIIIVAGIGTSQWDKYFIQWGKAPETQWAFEQPLVNAANLLLTAPEDMQRIVVVNKNGNIVDEVPMPAQTIKFIMNAKVSNETNIQTDKETIYVYLPTLESKLTDIINNQPTAILFLEHDQTTEQMLLKEFPQALLEKQQPSSLILIP